MIDAATFGLSTANTPLPSPPHPYWCDECGRKAPFTMRGCEIEHEEGCPRFGEDGYAVWLSAYEYVKRTGKSIP